MHAKPDPCRRQTVLPNADLESFSRHQHHLSSFLPSSSAISPPPPSSLSTRRVSCCRIVFSHQTIRNRTRSIVRAIMSSANPDYKWRPVPTNHFRYLRACMVCAVVLTLDEFTRRGCPNCHPVLDYTTGSDLAQMCTSPIYEGCITISEPKESWIARWLRLDKYVPGVYATKVVGDLPEDAMDYLSAENIEYIPRDGSENNLE